MTGPAWYLAESGAALAVFYGLFRLTLKDDTHFQMSRFSLLASLVAAHVLPLVHVSSPFRQAVVPRMPASAFDEMPVSQGPWDWQQLLLCVYAAGAVFVFLRLACHLRHLLLMARQHPVVHRDGIRLVYVEEDCSPFSFFRTAFVHRPAAGDEQLLEQVVAHERTHIRQGHSLDILLIQVVAIWQWFNPFIWLYRNALRELHEYLADREVLAQGFDPPTYRRILVQQRMSATPLEFAHHLRQSEIKRRLFMMARRSGRWTICKHLLALPALALLVVAFADPQVPEARGATKLEPEREKRVAALRSESAVVNARRPDFSDPVEVEELLRKVSRETVALEAERKNVTDSLKKEDLRKELDNLAKKRAALEARLVKLLKGT